MRTLCLLLLRTLCCPSGATASPSYPSYADFGGQAYNVSYDKRALTLNGEGALFLSGAVHPPRGTPDDWQGWFASAKANGLNMLQVYVFWNFHEEVEGQYNFAGRGNLTLFMEKAAAASIFINLRIGPYVCAEWTYGGLPAWLGEKPGVAFRQTNAVWQPAMEKWFNVVIGRMAEAKAFAGQGGPIMLVQVENELPATTDNYVEWCGTMAHKALDAVGVDVPVTMCNGQTAESTINTCNGNDCSGFLENHGQNGRVLVDQPALWTENEGGFQTWGGAPPPGKENYFWGRSMADQALSVMKWFARGGSHMDYYMWAGGNNFGRWTGDSVITAYAVDAIVCPDGLPHEPKFGQSSAMHRAIAQAAPQIVGHAAQLDSAVTVSASVKAYVYGSVAFLENSDGFGSPWTGSFRGHTFTVPAASSSLVDLWDGKSLFNTMTLDPAAAAAPARKLEPLAADALGEWEQWAEPILAADVPAAAQYSNASLIVGAAAPLEMTAFTLAFPPVAADPGARSQRSTYALYETSVQLSSAASAKNVLTVGSNEAMAMTAFVDGVAVPGATAIDVAHANGASVTFTFNLSAPAATAAAASGNAGAPRSLVLLAEELGYANYGFKNGLRKGVSGAVELDSTALAGKWTMRGGLAGEHLGLFTAAGGAKVQWTPSAGTDKGAPATWYRTKFPTPSSGQHGSLLLNATGLNRGRIWLNGRDAGRYFLMPRNDGSSCPGPAAPAAACDAPSYNNSAPYSGEQCFGLAEIPAGRASADACFQACCAASQPTWQWSNTATPPNTPGCWCGVCDPKQVPKKDPAWVGGHSDSVSLPTPCATQTHYYLPRSWFAPQGGTNLLTIFEGAGIATSAVKGGSVQQVRLAVASMATDANKAVSLTSISSCEF
jgi:beta-galactosidase